MTLVADPHTVPVVATYAYRERWAGVSSPFVTTLIVESGNRYNPGAIAVHLSGAKVGYVAPELARHMVDAVAARQRDGEGVSCPARLEEPKTRVDARIVLDMSAIDEVRGLR